MRLDQFGTTDIRLVRQTLQAYTELNTAEIWDSVAIGLRWGVVGCMIKDCDVGKLVGYVVQ